ncbi:hypothetical protein P691DRAFT_262410 [Macrolepiota fuliginosa MF-IS2]|uniref:Uncharacterized protein n=1 Tax=Macrolepiota fuliginosa MF-IS2 TaxID=1400762 RepID=A0A9P5X940_9AGAR|nr:hypothetical protein P691DRAFT_262410 [Macrolepiota fuliginosa MF-IS2]
MMADAQLYRAVSGDRNLLCIFCYVRVGTWVITAGLSMFGEVLPDWSSSMAFRSTPLGIKMSIQSVIAEYQMSSGLP